MIALASDHAGFEYKEKLKKLLNELQQPYRDFGPASNAQTDYPDWGHSASEAVSIGQCDRGILICGTGIGMSLTANKVPGIRAAVLMDPITARMSRSHNDVNVACFGARLQNLDDVKALLRIWLETAFEGGRHAVRLDKIRQIERHSC